MKYRRIALVTCVIITVLAVEWVWLRSERAGSAAQSSPLVAVQAAVAGGPFSLIDHTGKAVSDEDFLGDLVLMVFGYTFCPDVCPTTLQRVVEALDLLGGQGEQVQPLFVTIDPERDSPKVLAAYVSAFHPRMVGLTGSADQVRRITGNYRVYHAKVGSDDSDYLMDHSAYIYLVGADGRLLTYLRHDAAPEAIAAVIEPLLAPRTQTATAP